MSLTTVDQGLLNSTAQYTGFKNRIINGAMNVWQRATSFSISTTTVTYSADRWGIYQPSGTGTITQDTDVPTGFKYSLKAVGAGTDVLQRIESANVSDLSGATVTVSFWMKQTVGAGAGSMSLALQYAASSDVWSSPVSISTSTITATSSWAQYSVTFASLPSGAVNGLAVNIFPTSSGSSSTFYITGVQLEKGSTATSFDYRPYGTELALCQRYYQPLNFSSGSDTGVLGQAVTGTDVRGGCYYFLVTMRAAPSVVLPPAGKLTGQISFLTSGAGYPVTVGTHTAVSTTTSVVIAGGGYGAGTFTGGNASILFTQGSSTGSLSAEL